jgi:hypothetical protein
VAWRLPAWYRKLVSSAGLGLRLPAFGADTVW